MANRNRCPDHYFAWIVDLLDSIRPMESFAGTPIDRRIGHY